MIHQHPGGLRLTKRLIDYCAFSSGAKVVDIGCGTGETVQYLRHECGIDAVGVDAAAERLTAGKERWPDLPLIEVVAENLPFAADSVDGVVAECSLSVMRGAGNDTFNSTIVECKCKVIAEMGRILVAGGKLALTDIYDKNPDDGLPPVFLNYPALAGLLSENGFKILVWEDHSTHLKEFIASFIMKYGSIRELWQSITSVKNCPINDSAMKINKLSYFLLVAEKI